MDNSLHYLLTGQLDEPQTVKSAIELLLTGEPTGDIFDLLAACDKMEHLDKESALYFAQIALSLLLTEKLEKFPVDENAEAFHTYF